MVTAEIIAKDIDENGNIRIWTQYKNNGEEVPSKYPKIDGKSVFCTRYDASNFDSMTDKEIEDFILADIEKQVDNIIKVSYIKKNNAVIFNDKLNTIVGKNIEKDVADFRLNQTTVIKVKYDGSKIVS